MFKPIVTSSKYAIPVTKKSFSNLIKRETDYESDSLYQELMDTNRFEAVDYRGYCGPYVFFNIESGNDLHNILDKAYTIMRKHHLEPQEQ